MGTIGLTAAEHAFIRIMEQNVLTIVLVRRPTAMYSLGAYQVYTIVIVYDIHVPFF